MIKGDNMKTKLHNPLFWVSLISIVFAAAGVDFETLTSWDLLASALLSILQNPVALIACVVAFYGVWNDNSTKKLDGFS